MQLELLALPAVILLVITSVILVLGWDWRVSLGALGLQYAGVFILVGLTWPQEMAVIKLVTGWIAAAVLGMELVSLPADQNFQTRGPLSSQLFKLILAGLVVFATLSFGPQVARWMLQISYEQILGGLFLVGMGLLHLGISDHPFRVSIGLLTFLSGFEIIYATIETSALVAGFLAILALGIALVGSYLMIAPTIEEGS
jgi:hypothetical protein